MEGEITFVGTYRIPPDGFNEWTQAITDMVDFVRTSVPTLISFNVYIDESNSEATSIYVHPNAESLQAHLKVAASRIDRGAQMVEVVRIDLYGDPGQWVVERLHQVSEASNKFPISVKHHLYG